MIKRTKVLIGFVMVVALLAVSMTAYAALTFDATTITSDSLLTLTTAAGSNTVVTRGITFNSATSTDSVSIGGRTDFTGATASGTSIVIGADVSLFRNAANTLRIQGILSLANNILSATTTDSLYVGGLAQLTGATASATALVLGADVPLFRNAANQLRLQGTLSVSAGVTPNSATTTDSFTSTGRAILGGLTSLATTTPTTTRAVFISAPGGTTTTTLELSGKEGSRGSCIEMWQENTAYRMYVNASGTPSGRELRVEAGSCRD